MEITNDFEGECQCDLSRHIYFEHCFVHVRTDIEVLIKRYEYLKGLAESSCVEEDLRRRMECDGFFKSIIENSTHDNQELEEKIAALQEAITQTRKYNGRLLEEANKQRKRNDSEELARKQVECQEEKKKLMSQVAALEQEKAQLEAVAYFWRQKGGEMSHRYDQQASEIEDIIKDVAVVKQEMARVIELAGEYPAPEKQAESPCKEIKGVISIAMNAICQIESSIKEKLSGFLRDIDQIAQVNFSLETKCQNLEQELKTVSEEKSSLAERLVSKKNVEVELLALRQRCECSERQLAAAEVSEVTHKTSLAKQVKLEAKLTTAEVQVKQLHEELQEERRRLSDQITVVEVSRLTHKTSLAQQVELESKLTTAEVQVKQLQEELQEERSRLSEQITVVEERNKLLDKAKQENATIQQKNARQVETFKERINKLERRLKSTLFDLQATTEKLTVRQDEIEQLVHALEKRNKVTCNLEEEIVSLNLERSQHLNTISLLKNKIKELNSCLYKELESKVEHTEYLQQEVEKLEKDREQLISINDDVAEEIIEWQAIIEPLCLMINEMKYSLTEQTLEKENMISKDAVTSTTPRMLMLFSSRELLSSVSGFSEMKGGVCEIPADSQQVEHLTGRSQTPGTTTVTRTEQSRQVRICIGDDSVVTSAMNMVEDIKAQLRAYVQEETKKRNQEQIAMSKAQEVESELKGKCEELEKIRLELEVVKNKYNSVKREMHELRQQNRRLIKDLSVTEGTITRFDHEMNKSSSEITTLVHDVKKGHDTIRKQRDTIKELENTIKDLRKMLHERSATTIDEPESSRRIQEKDYTQVTMEIPLPEVTNKEQYSAEIAQETAGDGAYQYEKITSELEVRIKRMESSHHKEVEKLIREHTENTITLKNVFERERAKDRKSYEELVGKQQEMHEEQINEMKQLHDSELSFLRGNKERERISKEPLSPEDCTAPLATGAEVFPTQDNGATDPVTAKETILLIEENSFDMRIRLLKQQNAKELDPLKIEHARKLADITEELKNSLSEEEASLEKQLQALREENEQKLLRLKTRYCFEMKHENEKFNLCKRDVLESVKKVLSVSETQMMEIKPSSVAGSRRLAVGRSDTSNVMSSGSIVLSDFHAHTLRCLVHSGSEKLAGEQLEALHYLVCPKSCSMPIVLLWHKSSSQGLLRSISDFSDGQRDLLDEVYFHGCNPESEMDKHYMNEVVDFELKYKVPGEAERVRPRQAYSSAACSCSPIYDSL